MFVRAKTAGAPRGTGAPRVIPNPVCSEPTEIDQKSLLVENFVFFHDPRFHQIFIDFEDFVFGPFSKKLENIKHAKQRENVKQRERKEKESEKQKDADNLYFHFLP